MSEETHTNAIVIGGRSFELGKPPAVSYVHLLRLVRSIYRKGFEKLRQELGVSEEADLQTAMQSVDEIDFLLAAVGLLGMDDLNLLGAILLQFEDLDDGIRFVEQAGGFDIAWGLEALAIDLEHAELDRIKDAFFRLQGTIRKVRSE